MSYALIISRIFEPITLFLVFFVTVLLRAGITGREWMWYLAIVIGVIVLPSILLLLRAIRKKEISNWDISNRKQRVKALGVFLLFLGLGVLFVSRMGHPLVTQFFLFFLCIYIGFFSVTLLYKLSGHVAVAALFVGSMGYWFGGYAWLLLLVVPILGWSRLQLKRHTIGEVILGFVYGTLLLVVGIRSGLLG